MKTTIEQMQKIGEFIENNSKKIKYECIQNYKSNLRPITLMIEKL